MVNDLVGITDLVKKNRLLESVLNHLVYYCLRSIRYIFKTFTKKNENIVVIALHKLGDTVFTFNAIHVIKKKYKKNILIVCYPDSKPIFELIHPPELIIEIPKKLFFFNDRLASTKARKILKELNPHTIIDLTGVMTSASLIFNSAAKEIIGMNREIFKGMFTSFSKTKIRNHSTDIYINAIENYIGDGLKSGFVVKLNYDKKDLILIHPFAGWKSKEWSLKNFIDLAAELSKTFNCAIISEPYNIKDDIKSVLSNQNLRLIESNSIRDLISNIQKSALLIGNDSGAIQIAAFLGKPTFTLYGPTNPTFHLPIVNEKYNRFIKNNINCSPKVNERLCFTNGGLSGCPSFECLQSLSFNDVQDAILRFIYELDLVKSN